MRLIFPVIQEILKEDGTAFVLVKPQFECENKHIGKSGIVSPSAHTDILKKVLGYLYENGLYAHGIINAPIRKGKNVEYVLWITKKEKNAKSTLQILEKVKELVKFNSQGTLK